MTWLASNWHLIVGGIAALAGGGVLAWPYLPSVVGKAKADKGFHDRSANRVAAGRGTARGAGQRAGDGAHAEGAVRTAPRPG